MHASVPKNNNKGNSKQSTGFDFYEATKKEQTELSVA
jgi:hypothetical protein